jgi:antitoxin ChpS
MLPVPPAVLARLDLHAGATVGLTVENGRLVVEPAPRPHYRLEQLLAQCKPVRKRRTIEERAWLDARPVGRELF